MIKHLVMFKFKEEAEGCTRKENMQTAKKMLENLEEKIPQIQYLKVSTMIVAGTSSFDLVLDTSFNNVEDLDIYQNQEDHMVVKGFMKKVVDKREMIDYEI